MATNASIYTSLAYPRDVSEALKSILGSESISDVYLKGNDGTTVPVSKCILAAWSPVFYGMLYGKFSEASASIIDIDFPSITIRQMIEFCYTNKVEFIEKMDVLTIEDPQKLQDTVEVRHIKEMVWLFNAANYYQINKLKDNVKQFLAIKVFRTIPWTSCYVLEESAANEELTTMSLVFILELPCYVFYKDDDEKSLRFLSASALSKILENESINASESFLFSCLQRWAVLEDDQRTGQQLNTKSHHGDEPASFGKDKRKKNAVAMAKHINLARIPLSKLATVVEPSGLVGNQDLLKAYVKQALLLSVLIQRGPPRLNVDIEWGLLQDLHRSEFAGAIEIGVQGAGLDGVNGTYVLDGEYGCRPVYYHEGKLNGENRTFWIYYDCEIGHWVLCHTDENEILYISETIQVRKIPTTGWKAANDGYGPAPALIYKEDEI